MTVQTKFNIILGVAALLLTVALFLVVRQLGVAKARADAELVTLRASLDDQKQINDGLIRAAASQVTASELRQVVNEQMIGIEDDLKDINGKVVALGVATGRLRGSTGRPGPSDRVTLAGGVPKWRKEIATTSPDGRVSLPLAWAEVEPLGPDLKALEARLRVLLGPQATATVNEVVAYLSDPQTARWATGSYPVDFTVKVADVEVGKDGVQTQYVQIAAGPPGAGPEQSIPLATVKATYKYTDQTKPEFRWWTPHVDGGISVAVPVATGAASVGGALGFVASSYGRTESDNDWRFGRVAVATDGDQVWGEVDPAGWNAGKPLPLLDDLWLYGGMTFGPDGYGVGLSITSTF